MTDIAHMLRLAMQSERDGYNHYANAALRTEDPKAKEVFQGLANDELLHHKALDEILKEYTQQGSLPNIPPLEGKASVDVDNFSPIFSPEFKQRIQDKHFEISALSIAMTLEQGEISFYTDLAGKTVNSTFRAFFTKLADWDKTHLEALSRQMGYLRESYWAEFRFEPF